MAERYTHYEEDQLPGLPGILRAPARYGRTLRRNLRVRLSERPFSTGLLLAAAVLLFAFWVGAMALVVWTPAVDDLNASEFARSTVVYTADGEELTRFYDENRIWVPLDSIAPVVPKALIATEDRRFYEHSGIDVVRVVGSAIETLKGNPQGGSTITMQLVRNAYPEIGDDFAPARKAEEWITAYRISKHYPKDKVLEIYLNTMPFMYNTYGIEAAAQTYFSRPAARLDTLQAATLVGMLKGPTLYNPVRNPETSKERRNVVLNQMVETGYLSQEAYERLRVRETELDFEQRARMSGRAPYFAQHVRQQLESWAATNDYNLYTDGLRVHTTLDTAMQRAAEQAVGRQLEDLQAVVDVAWSEVSPPEFSNAEAYHRRHDEEAAFSYFWENHPEVLDALIRNTRRFRQRVEEGADEERALEELRPNEAFVDSLKAVEERLEAGFVAIEPASGRVKAWVGGRDFTEDRYDHVAQARRQPGSTFKPFVYATALSQGYGPNDLLRDRQITYVDQRTGQRWEPANFARETGQLIPLEEGLVQSKNTITSQLTIDVGPERVAETARRMGIESELEEVPSLGLGTSEVTLLELTAAYATLANNGRYRAPLTVARIEDRYGRVIERFVPESRQAIAPETAYGVLDMMRGVIERGTGQALQAYASGDDLAGKTGTTQHGADGWFMLLHPELATGAWVGFDSPALTFRSEYWGQGSRTALPIVGRFLERVDLSADTSFAAPPAYEPPAAFDVATRDTTFFEQATDKLRDLFADDNVRTSEEDYYLPATDEDTTAVEGQEAADSLNQQERLDLLGGGESESGGGSAFPERR